jgi:Tfp pilus assembly protein FimT
MFSRVAITPSKGAHAGSQMAGGGSVVREFGARSKRGFSLLELLIVVGISITIVAIAMPSFINAFYSIRLKSAASNLSSLMQQARIQSARQNKINTIAYNANPPQACIDANTNGTCDPTETVITFNQSISMSTGVPSGAGAPPAYVLVGDTAGTTYDNATILGYSARGLPCAYSAGVCSTPAAGYFVYYIKDARVGSTGWAGVVVTRSGRTKPIIWNGASWE